MRPSLYADCVREKYGCEIYEDDDGFFSYTVKDAFVIAEYYIKPKSRTFKVYLRYLNLMNEQARALGFGEIYISIFLNAKNDLREATLAYALRSGFKLKDSTSTHINLSREVV